MKQNKQVQAASAPAKKSVKKIDPVFLTLVLILLAVGLVALFSASYAYAYYYEGNSYHYIFRQSIFAVGGVVAMIFIGNFIPASFMRKWVWFLLGLTNILLVLALLSPPINEAHRWIFLGSFTFQPSEMAKFAVILGFAHVIEKYYGNKNKFGYKIGQYILIIAPICGLVIIEPHISATILLVGIAGSMLFIGDNDKRIWISLFAVIAAAAVAFVALPGLRNRALSRIGPWIKSFTSLDVDLMHYQTKQSLYAIASGGLFGVGLGNSRQKHLYLPEPQNDFIFAIWCEEMGVIGAVLVIVLFALIIWRGFYIAVRAKDRFSSLLCAGITLQIALQSLLNVAVVTNCLPNTGIALPFFSYGGTQLFILLCEMGAVLSVSKWARLEK